MDAQKAQLQVNTISLGSKSYTDQMGTIAHAFLGTYLDISGTEMDNIVQVLSQFYQKTSIPLFHNSQAIYENVPPGNIFFENTIFTGSELMILGKLDTKCEAPIANFGVGGEIVNNPSKFFVCDNQSSYFDFPDVGMVNPNGGASAETSLERMFNYYKITKDIKKLASNPSLRESIVQDAIENNFVTDLTSMYLEDSTEFIGTSDYDLPPVVQVPQFSSKFGGTSSSGGRIVGGTDVSAVIDSQEFCENPGLSIDLGNERARYDSVVHIESYLTEMDDFEQESFYTKLIGDSDDIYYFEDGTITYQNGQYKRTNYPTIPNGNYIEYLCRLADVRPGHVVVMKTCV